MVTVSTSNPPARAYHHGDLRTALVEAGLHALDSTAVEDLSLRQIARDVGVSATAVYRHFPDKRALLAALAHEGFERLGTAQQHAAAGAPSGDDFAASGRAYVRFALNHPALFRLIFTYGEQFEGPHPDNLAARLLRDQIAAQAGGNASQAERMALQAWALVHGLAMLMLDGRVTPDQELIDRVIDPGSIFAAHPAGNSSELSP